MHADCARAIGQMAVAERHVLTLSGRDRLLEFSERAARV